MRTFRLFCFSDGTRTLATRGVNQEQAMSYASRSEYFPRGVTIYPEDYCPIDLATQYSSNHFPGWLYSPPQWLQTQEFKRSVLDKSFDPETEVLLCSN